MHRDLPGQNSSHDRPNRPNHIQHRNQQDANDPGLEIREVGLGRLVAQQFRRGIDPIPRATPPASADAPPMFESATWTFLPVRGACRAP